MLVISKSQHNLIETFNQELSDLSLISKNQIQASFNQNDQQMSNDFLKRIDLDGQSAVSALLITPLYQFQQRTIDMQQAEIESHKNSYNKLLKERNDIKIELESRQRDLKLKETKLDELSQTLTMEVVDMKGELLKSHHRIQSSLMNVNKRLEEEILKLRANLNEQMAKNAKLSEQIEFYRTKEFESSKTQLLDSIQSLHSQISLRGMPE